MASKPLPPPGLPYELSPAMERHRQQQMDQATAILAQDEPQLRPNFQHRGPRLAVAHWKGGKAEIEPGVGAFANRWLYRIYGRGGQLLDSGSCATKSAAQATVAAFRLSRAPTADDRADS